MKLFPQLRKKQKRTKQNSAEIGVLAEKAALNFLKQQGLLYKQSNYHCRFGEIDLIMYDNNTLVFVEVRCRAENAQVSAAETITPAKIRKIQKTAQFFLMNYNEVPDCRFDVMAMTHNNGKIGYNINWIKGAF